MPNSHNPDYVPDELAEREKLMAQSEWLVDIESYMHLGLAIASFNKAIGSESFVGTAEMKVEEGVRTLEILICFDENELHRCIVCEKIPLRITLDNPGICVFCGKKVCSNCAKKHEQSHWRPQKTIGGDRICVEGHPCGIEGCPQCHGVPF